MAVSRCLGVRPFLLRGGAGSLAVLRRALRLLGILPGAQVASGVVTLVGVRCSRGAIPSCGFSGSRCRPGTATGLSSVLVLLVWVFALCGSLLLVLFFGFRVDGVGSGFFAYAIFGRFCVIFRVAGCLPGGGFAECCFSNFHHFPEFLLLFAAPDQGSCQGEGLTQTALSSGALGSLVGLLRGGSVSTLRVGSAASADLCRGTATRSFPTRGKRGYVHHSNTHRERATHALRTTASRAHSTTCLASLAHNPRRYEVSAARDAERRNAQRSTARVRGTCTTCTLRTNMCVHAL